MECLDPFTSDSQQCIGTPLSKELLFKIPGSGSGKFYFTGRLRGQKPIANEPANHFDEVGSEISCRGGAILNLVQKFTIRTISTDGDALAG